MKRQTLKFSPWLIVSVIFALLATNHTNRVAAAGADPDVTIARALDLMKQKEYKHAYTLFKDAAKVRQTMTVNYNLGICAAHCHESAVAREAFSKVIVMTTPDKDLNKNLTKLLKTQYGTTVYSCVTTAIRPPGIVRWAKSAMPLKVYVSDGNCLPGGYTEQPLQPFDNQDLCKQARTPGRLAKYPVPIDFKPSYKKAVVQGLLAWDWAVKEKIVSFILTNDPAKADIIVLWTRRVYTGGAAAYVPWSDRDPAFIFLPLNPIQDHDAEFAHKAIANFTAHEIGHILGLRDGNDRGDLMSAHRDTEIDQNNVGCAPADMATLRTLYSLPANKTYLGSK